MKGIPDPNTSQDVRLRDAARNVRPRGLDASRAGLVRHVRPTFAGGRRRVLEEAVYARAGELGRDRAAATSARRSVFDPSTASLVDVARGVRHCSSRGGRVAATACWWDA